jgi:hypothetical protein
VAKIFARRGHIAEATAMHVEAQAIFGRMGAKWDLDWTSALIAKYGIA